MRYNVPSLVCLVSIQFLSFICAIYVLFCCIQQRSTVRNLPNHLIVCLLFVSTWFLSIDLISTEIFHWSGFVPIQTVWACRVYNVSFFSTSTLNRMLMAFMSVERHFLVFRPQLYRIRRLRFIIHYLPIILILIWSFTYSIITDIFLTCPSLRFRYGRFLCGYTCSLQLSQTIMIYVWIQVFLPTAITTIACILLPIRFLLKKRTLQRLEWRRARKMIVQMTTIAGTYILCWLPYAIILQCVAADMNLLNDYYISTYLIFDCYVPALITPFICFDTISGWNKTEFMKKIIRFCSPHRQSTIHPVQTQNLTINQRNEVQQ